ncbi:MAG: VOC family protein [Rhodobacteraceae bacterium]|nr:VOC family protein [Paracoccaceae bacterium]
MRYAHTMVRITNIDESLDFWVNKMGFEEVRRNEVPEGRFTLIFLAPPQDVPGARTNRTPELELTYNWDSDEIYTTGRAWGHLAYRVDDIYAVCQGLMDKGVALNRPPRDGRMAFVKSPDNISVELIQDGAALPVQEPWAGMKNTGDW